MNVRPFDWRDLPALHRYRNASVFLDTALVLTRGYLVVPGVILSYLAPSMGILTCVSSHENGDEPKLMGQAIHLPGASLSHLTFLAPDNALHPEIVAPVVEYLMIASGERGAMRLIAEVDEHSRAFESLRSCGFAIYNRQRLWQLTGGIEGKERANTWRMAGDRDIIPIRNLYNNLVPGLVQQIEPFSSQRPHGMVYYQEGELLAYVEIKYGHRGIWTQPFIHPDAEDITTRFVDLIGKIPGRRNRPIYICIRSYQSWLEPAIEAFGAEAGLRQAVMARQLVVQQRAARAFSMPALEGGQAEITAPIARIKNR